MGPRFEHFGPGSRWRFVRGRPTLDGEGSQREEKPCPTAVNAASTHGLRLPPSRPSAPLRNGAAGISLATVRDAQVAHPLGRPTQPNRKPVARHANPHSEEGTSLRRSVLRPPIPSTTEAEPTCG